MSEEQINKIETLHNEIYKDTKEYGRAQFVSRIVDLENNWNELKKYLTKEQARIVIENTNEDEFIDTEELYDNSTDI